MAQTTTPAPASRRTRGVDAAIGNTPLIPLRRIAPGEGAGVWVKLEGRNPGGSVKDRPALWIVRTAEEAGDLAPGRTLLDASSGNTGIAYAMLCAARGYGCEICIPRNASEERKGLLRAYGATLVLTDPAEGQDGAIREAEARVRDEPERYFYARQYDNPANPRAHYESTAPEIVRQTRGRITHFVAALGTSGTFVGTGRRLREELPSVRLVAVQPDSPFHGLEGVKHMETARVPGIWDPGIADEVVTVATEEAQATARRLAREEGLLGGVSGGANVAAALRVARELPADRLVVTLLPDGGERYLGEPWLRDA